MILHLIILALGALMFLSGAIIEHKIKDEWVGPLDYVAVGLYIAGVCSMLISLYCMLIK